MRESLEPRVKGAKDSVYFMRRKVERRLLLILPDSAGRRGRVPAWRPEPRPDFHVSGQVHRRSMTTTRARIHCDHFVFFTSEKFEVILSLTLRFIDVRILVTSSQSASRAWYIPRSSRESFWSVVMVTLNAVTYLQVIKSMAKDWHG